MKLLRTSANLFPPRILRLRAIMLLLILTWIAPYSAKNFAGEVKDDDQSRAATAVNGPNAPSAQDLNSKPSRASSMADAAELAALADKLREELKKTNVSVLPFASIQKTQALEKLARKIKGEAGVAR